MVNEGCIFECPDQIFHSCSLTISRGNIQNAEKIFFCGKLKPDQHWRFLTGQYIPPKFLSNYCDLVDEFKIGTRSFETDEIIKILTEYINEEDITIFRAMQSSHGGSLFYFRANLKNARGASKNNLYLKPYPSDFFKARSFCKNKCYKCNYCKCVLLP